MNGKKIFLLFLAIIVAGVLLASSTWRQWNDNQKTLLERTGPILPIAEFNHGVRIHAIAFSPRNPNLIVTTGEDYTIKVWDRHNTQAPEVVLTGMLAHDGSGDTYSVECISFSPTGEWLIRKINWMLEFWDVSSKKKLNSFDIGPSNAAISPANHLLATAFNDVRLWNISNPNEIIGMFVLPPLIGEQALSHEDVRLSKHHHTDLAVKHHNETLNQNYRMVDISNDGKWVAAGGGIYDKTIRRYFDKVKVWNLQSKQLVKIIERKIPDDRRPGEYRQDIQFICFSLDNRFFAVAGESELTIWSLPEWNIYHKLPCQHISDMAFSPSGKIFAIVDVKGITLWSVDNMTSIALLKRKSLWDSVTKIAFSPEGNMLAGTEYDGILSLWDLRELNER
ncbi:MAG: hypothetical protein OXI67_10580 [Candidatus Poribacteria bacterium]|nr:hypothetical protein [Candidatus Poribacteria bacterium]